MIKCINKPDVAGIRSKYKELEQGMSVFHEDSLRRLIELITIIPALLDRIETLEEALTLAVLPGRDTDGV